jgi:uncharacterized protein (TIGR03083 family)
VRDQLSHLIGIERSLLGEAAPSWEEPLGDHVRNDFATQNEPWIAVRRGQPGRVIRDEFVAVTNRRLATLRSLTEAEWAHVGPSIVGEVPYAEFMRVRVFDCWVHEQDVRRALGRPGGTGGLASDIGLGQVMGAMGFVVAKLAGAPEGTVVRFTLRGPGTDGRQFAVGVDGGRARPAPADGAPTVTLTLSGVDFVRLGCGRASWEAVRAAGGIDVGGDAALGERILGAMNFMF